MFEGVTFSQIVDMKEPEFRDLLEKGNLPLGETLSLKNLLNLTYDHMVEVKDALIAKFNDKATDEKTKADIDVVFAGMISKMMSIELKCCILKERVNRLLKLDI